ncbi:hypothetical protein HDU90_004568 [Geranomyces variabilis]|nr:hypothetical protein HDU90_004568 [Geranomyces variabilis]
MPSPGRSNVRSRGRGGGAGRGRGGGASGRKGAGVGSESKSRNLQEWEHVGEDEEMDRLMRRMQSFDAPTDEEMDDDEESDESDQADERTARRKQMERENEDESSSEGDFEQDSDSQSEAEDDDSEEEDEAGSEDEDDAKLERVRRELAEVPFDQLIEIQQSVGMKKFHSNYRGARNMDSGAASDTSDVADFAPKKKTKYLSARDIERGEKSSGKLIRPAKRANKNMPLEVTSKRAVTRKRDVVELPKNKSRDPRFDPLAGKLNEGLFDSSYGFLRDYEQSEIEMLKKQIITEKNPEIKMQMQETLTSMTSRMQARKTKEKRKALLKDWKKKEAALVQQGKKPWQLKNSDIKKMELVEKYKSMKSKDVEKLLEKRRKKNATKERRFLPYARRSAQ